MVAACAGCNQMPSWATTITGFGAALTYFALSELSIYLRVDDPLDAFAVHFGGGLWGLISACFLVENGIIASLFDATQDLHAVQNAFVVI